MKIDSREFSQEAYQSLYQLKRQLNQLAEDVLKENKDNRTPTAEEIKKKAESYYEKSSSLIQGLAVYISTWGLHRLSGDAKKFSIGTASDTQYKGRVYGLFLEQLKEFSKEDFVIWNHGGNNADDERSLVNMNLRKYTSLNRLAMQLAREWSFWATSILEEDKVKHKAPEVT